MAIWHSLVSALLRLAGGVGLCLVAACSPATGPGDPWRRDFPAPALPAPAFQSALPGAEGEVIGSGPVRVAMILPLSGNDEAARVGRAMANAARLAMDSLSRGGHAVHLVLKDSGAGEGRAGAAAQAAAREGASLILGPLRASAVSEAGAIARAANIPLIGFSNTASIARPGVYLLSVLPEAEIMRVLTHARAEGRRSVAALVPANTYGQAMGAAFENAASELGMQIRGVLTFGDEAQARQRVEQLVPQLRAGQVDTLFIPDAATAPNFGTLLEATGLPREGITILGSADWAGQAEIFAHAYLAGALFPAIDAAGLAALTPDYRARFGDQPPQLATIAYSAVVLANTRALAHAAPRYSAQMLLSPAGFGGRDGPFRFHHDGRGEYGLVLNRVSQGGAQQIEPAKLVGITRAPADRGQLEGANIIPPVGSSLVPASH